MTDTERLYRRISLRLIPFMMLLLFVAILDRVNVGFAALTMNQDIGLTPYIFGWGAGIFFIGYFAFEVPSNVVMERVGARRWIARIMITWGAVSAAMAFVQGPTSFIILRFLLGVAEAGFFPGMILYLTYWFPSDRRAHISSLFVVAIPLANVLGAPISGLIIDVHSFLGLKGWQWLFLGEGIPSVLLGFAVFRFLPDGPEDAKWLNAKERAEVHRVLDADRRAEVSGKLTGLWPALRDWRVIVLGFVDFGIVFGYYGVGLWLPQVVKAMGFSDIEVGFVTALPSAAAAIAMLLWARHSDQVGERRWHVASAAALGAAGLAISVCFQSPLPSLLSLGVATAAMYAALGPFWAISPRFLRGPAAAGGLALINSIGALGGFVGPYLVGWIKESTGSFELALGTLAIGVAAAAILVLLIPRERAASR